MSHSQNPLSKIDSRILTTLRSKTAKRFRGFTLVELIVVITILAILATIGFLALSGYTSDANKSAVVGNLRTVEKGLSTNATVTGKFPSPSGAVTVTYSGGTAWYQGTAGKSVMSVIGMGEPPKDPQGNSEFDYSLSANGMEYQVASAYLSAASAEGFVTEASAATTDGTNVRVPTAAVTGNYNGLFVPVSTGGTNYLVAAPSIILSNVSLSSRELKSMSPSFVVDGKPGTPASWSGKVAGLSQTGISFGWAAYASGKIFESQTEAFPKTSTGVSALASALSSSYSGTSLASVSKIATFLASPSGMAKAVEGAAINALGRDFVPATNGNSNPVNGTCWTASGSTVTTAPSADLCSAWSLSWSVSGNGPWNWTCAWSNGGTSSVCSAYKTFSAPIIDKWIDSFGTLQSNKWWLTPITDGYELVSTNTSGMVYFWAQNAGKTSGKWYYRFSIVRDTNIPFLRDSSWTNLPDNFSVWSQVSWATNLLLLADLDGLQYKFVNCANGTNLATVTLPTWKTFYPGLSVHQPASLSWIGRVYFGNLWTCGNYVPTGYSAWSAN